MLKTWAICGGFAVVGTCAFAVAAVPVQTLALTGQAATGATPAGTFSQVFGPPSQSHAGTAIFQSQISGPGITSSNNRGIWIRQQDGLALAAQLGDQVLGLPNGTIYGEFSGSGSVNGAGQVALGVALSGPGVTPSNGFAIVAGFPGSLAVIARYGDQIAGLPPATVFSQFSGRTTFNDTGQAAFWGYATRNSTTFQGIWRGTPGNLALVASEGGTAGYGDTVQFDGFSNTLSLNAAGNVAFMARLRGTGVTTANSNGIWMASSAGVTPVARESEHAQGFPVGVSFQAFTFDSPGFNSSGQIAFQSYLQGPGMNSSNNQTLWVGTPGALTAFARTGELAPGAGTGLRFNAFQRPPVINDNGQVAFTSRLSSGQFGFWAGNPTSLSLVAREGAQAPGTAPGVTFTNIGFDAPMLNDLGQVAFDALLQGPGVTVDNRKGIWASDPSGQLHLVVRAGDLLEVSPGDFRTILELSLVRNSGGGDGRAGSLDEQGRLAFGAIFTDGSTGIFRAIVPEPTGMILWGIGALVLRRRR